MTPQIQGILLEIYKKHFLGSWPKGLASFVLTITVINLGFAMWKYCK